MASIISNVENEVAELLAEQEPSMQPWYCFCEEHERQESALLVMLNNVKLFLPEKKQLNIT